MCTGFHVLNNLHNLHWVLVCWKPMEAPCTFPSCYAANDLLYPRCASSGHLPQVLYMSAMLSVLLAAIKLEVVSVGRPVQSIFWKLSLAPRLSKQKKTDRHWLEHFTNALLAKVEKVILDLLKEPGTEFPKKYFFCQKKEITLSKTR